MQLTVPNRDGPQLGDPSDDVVPVERVLRQLYKNRSSRKTDSQKEKRSSGSPILLQIVSDNQFSGKTYFYTIASRQLVQPRGDRGDHRPAQQQHLRDTRDTRESREERCG